MTMSTLKTKTQTRDSMVSTDMVRTYLHEIGRVPLLTHEQEIVLGKQVQQLMELLEAREKLTTSLDRSPTAEEWAEQANLSVADLNTAVRRGQRAKQKMIEANLRLVVSVAKNTRSAIWNCWI